MSGAPPRAQSRGPSPPRGSERRTTEDEDSPKMTTAGTTSSLVAKIAALQDAKTYAELNWEGSFEDYLAIVRQNPRVTRTAFQRIYDMILSHGKTEYIDNKKK